MMTILIVDIQTAVAGYYGLTMQQFLARGRRRRFVRPRQLAMKLCRDLTQKSYPEIGARFGGRDHTTVLHGVTHMATLIEHDPDIRGDYEAINKILTQAVQQLQ